MAQNSDVYIDASVSEEACPHDLAPTSSTTAQLVLGDALAVSLLELRNFSDADFARFHPGGSLGKRMYLKVSDIVSEDSLAKVLVSDSIQKVIIEISNKRVGATSVFSDDKLLGIITDGDLRRMLERNTDINSINASNIMCSNPKIISSDQLAKEALNIMEQNNINQLLVVDRGNYIGIIHIHDILKEGI